MFTKNKMRWRSFTRQEKIFLPITHFILLIFAVWAVLPIFFAILNSLKNVQDYNLDALSIPKILKISNYKDALNITYRNTTIMGMFANSVFFTLTFSLAGVFTSCMSAYVIAKYDFRLKKYLYSLAIIVQIIPIFGTMGASYLLVSDLNLLDNMGLLWITACAGFDYTFLIVHSYFKNVSWNYAEAAFIDGAGNFYVFIKIMIPIIMPAVLTMWLSTVISLWNDYMTPMLYLPSTPTLSTGIFNLKSLAAYIEGGVTVYFAAIVISIIPILIIFVALQKKIFSINIDGGIKG